MRLIDADKLSEAITTNIGILMLSGFDRCNGKTLRTNVLKEVRQMIVDAPTVEAIHVEWLKEWAKKKDEFFEGELYAYLISAILLDWHMRKEE